MMTALKASVVLNLQEIVPLLGLSSEFNNQIISVSNPNKSCILRLFYSCIITFRHRHFYALLPLHPLLYWDPWDTIPQVCE
jgi:hypothetical protein